MTHTRLATRSSPQLQLGDSQRVVSMAAVINHMIFGLRWANAVVLLYRKGQSTVTLPGLTHTNVVP